MTDLLQRVRRHLGDPDSPHRQIAVGFLWVSAFVFFGKLAGAAKEMAIAWRYGVSAKVDAYVFVFNLVNWPVAVWLSVLTIVLVPLVVRLRHDAPEELPRFRAELLGLTLLIGAALGLLAWWGLPLLLQAGWLGLSGAALTEALGMAGGLAMLAPLGVVISLFSAWLLAAGRHRNTLFEAIQALTLLVALLLPPGWLPEPLVWGTVAGFALHAAALAAPLRMVGELPAPRLAQRSPAWRWFWGSIGVMAVGQVLTTSTNLIDQFFAASLNEGALAMLNYANRVLALLLGLGATAISRATLPVFSAYQATDSRETNILALYWAGIMLAAGILMVLIGWILAPWGVRLLFERGAFTSENTFDVANILRYALLQVPFYFFSLVLVSVLAAKAAYKQIASIAAANLFVKLVALYFLSSNFEIIGLVVSSAVMYGVSAILLFGVVFHSRLPWRN